MVFDSRVWILSWTPEPKFSFTLLLVSLYLNPQQEPADSTPTTRTCQRSSGRTLKTGFCLVKICCNATVTMKQHKNWGLTDSPSQRSWRARTSTQRDTELIQDSPGSTKTIISDPNRIFWSPVWVTHQSELHQEPETPLFFCTVSVNVGILTETGSSSGPRPVLF